MHMHTRTPKCTVCMDPRSVMEFGRIAKRGKMRRLNRSGAPWSRLVRPLTCIPKSTVVCTHGPSTVELKPELPWKHLAITGVVGVTIEGVTEYIHLHDKSLVDQEGIIMHMPRGQKVNDSCLFESGVKSPEYRLPYPLRQQTESKKKV